MKINRTTILLFVISTTFCLGTLVCEAVPSYTRNLQVDCRKCHSVFPHLKAYGKQFKEGMGEDLTQVDFGKISLSSDFLSALIKLRPIDKRTAKDKKTALTAKDKQLKERTGHELEIFFTGRTEKMFYFAELEAEDEFEDEGRPGFDIRVVDAWVGYQISPEINIIGGFTSPFVFDGNNTVNHHKFLRRDWNASKFVPGTSQMVGIAGRIAQSYTYTVAFHGDDDDTEGHDPRTVSFRGTVDIVDQTIGAYYTSGRHYNSVTGRSDIEYDLYGIDARLFVADTNILLLYGVRDEKTDGVRNENFSIEAYRTFGNWTPAVNLDWFTKGSNDEKWTKGTVALIYSWRPNLRLTLGLEGTIDAPDAYIEKERRYTLLVDFGF